MEAIISRIQKGETELLEDLILDNINIITYYTKKYKNVFEDYEDLVQEATITFISAVYSYKFDKFFSEYVGLKIFCAVNKYIAEHLRQINDKCFRQNIVNKLYKNCEKKLGHRPNLVEFYTHHGIKASEAQEILNCYYINDLYPALENNLNYYDDDSLERLLDFVDSEIFMKKLQNSSLTKSEKEYIYLKYEKDLTDGEIAKMLNMTVKGAYFRKSRSRDKIKRLLSYR